MITNQLNVLLAERQLSIKQVVTDLDISRSTISNIINNPVANVATETIDKLCNYLSVTPSQFFAYAPYTFDFSYGVQGLKDGDSGKLVLDDFVYNELLIYIRVTTNRNEKLMPYYVNFSTNEEDDNGEPFKGEYDLYIKLEDDNESIGLLKIYNNLPVAFQTQLSNTLVSEILRALSYFKIDFPVLNSEGLKGAFPLREFVKDKKPKNIAFDLPWFRIKKQISLEKYITQ